MTCMMSLYHSRTASGYKRGICLLIRALYTHTTITTAISIPKAIVTTIAAIIPIDKRGRVPESGGSLRLSLLTSSLLLLTIWVGGDDDVRLSRKEQGETMIRNSMRNIIVQMFKV